MKQKANYLRSPKHRSEETSPTASPQGEAPHVVHFNESPATRTDLTLVMCMYLLLVLLLLAIPGESSAEIYACANIDGEIYTEKPQSSGCRLLEIQPPALVYERANSGAGFRVEGSGPWPQGSPEAQAEICRLYREWATLSSRRYTYSFDFPPHGLTPLELNRLYNLDFLFSHRGEPNCGAKP